MRKKNTTNEQLHTQPQFRLKPVCAAVLLAFAVQTAQANPLGGTVAAGQASFATSGNTLTVTNTPGTIINWQGFSIGANEITRFAQQSASSAVLNRVISNNPSSILGTLQSNGRVFLINPGGIVFGAGAVVDVAGMVASTLNLSNADFLAGRNHYTQVPGAGNVSNAGNITAHGDGQGNGLSGGQIYLIAPDVENTGVITAPNGEILLAAGYSVDLVSTNDPNLRVNITAPAGDATNVGQLIASSGSLGLFGTVVRNSGMVSADSATMQGGKIVFRATQRVEAGGRISAHGAGGGEIKLLADMQSGTVNVSGTLDASAPVSGNGGFIETSAAHVQVADTARITTAAANGNNGTWLIDPTDFTIAASDPLNGSSYMSNTALATSLGSGNVTILTLASGAGNGDIFVNDAVSWASPNSLTLNAIRNIEVNAAISNAGTGNLILRSDLNGSSIGTIIFGASGSVALSGGGRTDLYYNPVSYTDATRSDALFNPYTANITGAYTAWMLVNDVGLDVGGTLGLQAMGTNLAGNYALGKDFTAATSLWNAGAGFAPVGNISTPFTGSFDGLGHTIDGLFINLPDTSYVGLFGFTRASTIKNVALINVNISGYSYVGSLVGWHQGTLTNSSNATGTVTGKMDAASLGGNSIGGLVGMNYNYSAIDNCSSGSTVSGDNYVGGLVGSSQQSNISNSSASGTVMGTQSYAGGLVGDSYITNITSGTATGNVNGVSNVGGLVGRNGYSSNITNGIASGTVTGTNDVGGLVGMNASSIDGSHATGSVTGTSNVGGLVGNNYYDSNPSSYQTYGSVTNSYANTGTVKGVSNVGGLVGYNYIYSSVGTSNAGGAVTGNSNVGGLVGTNDRGSITTVYASGSVTGNGAGSTSLGGLVGNNSGTITNGYVTSVSVTGVNNVGGLVGYNNIYFSYTNSISGSYVSGGSVTGTSNVGGLVGSNTGTLTNSHYNINGVTINSANIVTLGGLYNDNSASFNVVGQYTDWLVNGNKSLNILNYTTPYGSFGTTGGNSYTISNAQGLKDMLGFADNSLYTFTLTGNIDLTSMAGFYVPILASSFDGAGFKISNLSLNLPTSNLGFFGFVSSTSTVSNMVLVDATVNGGGSNNVGVLAGLNGGTINNSSVSTSVGGSVSVSGANSVGGLVGNNNGTINNSSISASGTGSVNVAGATNVGGLAGENLGAITNSYVSSGAVTATVSNIGGLVGGGYGTSTNSFFNVDAVTTNGGNNVTVAGLYTTQFTDWLSVGTPLTPLLITDYSTSLVLQLDGSYGIGTLQGMKDMLGFADNPVYNFSLTSSRGLNILPGFNVPNLAGSFNGNNHTLSNLNINLPNNNLGLFGVTSSSSVVSNINLVNANVSGYGTVGALVGNNFGNIDNVSVTGTVSVTGVNSGIGGLVGQNNGGAFSISGALIGGAISNSYVNGGTVTGSNGDVGGLVGYNNRGNIATSSHVDNTAVSGTSHVGGLVGNNQGSTSYSAGAVKGNITNSYVTNGTVTSTGGALDKAIGGLVGFNFKGDISGSHVLNSTVNGGSASWVGGLVGRNEGGVNSVYKGSATGYVNVYFGTISNSYVSGGTVSTTGNDVGGLVGNNWGALIDNSSVDSVGVTGNLNVGGLVGNDSGEGSSPSIGIVSNSHALNTQVTGSSHVGGLIGHVGVTSFSHSNYDAVFNSYVDHGTVTSNATSVSASASAIGGLVGYNSYGNISSSYVTNGTVMNGGIASNVGGLVGYNIGSSSGSNRYGVISSSYVNGGTVSGGSSVGGLVGSNSGSISNSYVIGSSVVSAATDSGWVGGLVGYNSGTISTSYASTGVINPGGYYGFGGLVGNNAGGVTDSFWDIDTSGTSIGIDAGTNAGATGIYSNTPTVNAFTQATYTGFDFGTTWWMAEGNTRPFLQMEYSTNITNAHQLQLMSMNPGASYTLGANIDMTETALPSGMWSNAGFVPVGNGSTSFTGQFDGFGNTISSLFINRPLESNVGLFGVVSGAGAVNNVGMVGGNVTGSYYVGGLVGSNYGTINNSSASGNVTGSYEVGGLVGVNGGTINNSHASGIVTGSGYGYIGGLAGFNYGTISDSSASGNVTGSYEVGGLVGYNASGGTNISGPWGAHINNSYVSSGSVMGTSDVGGLVGANYGVIKNAHYNINGVLINGSSQVTRYGLYGTQYLSWFNGGLLTPLDIANYSGLGGSLEWNGSTYTVKDVQGMQDLLGFADDPAAYSFSLTASISLPSGLYIPYLAGSFDGGSLSGFTISNLNVNQPYNSNLGLFGHIALGSTVSNVALVDVTVTGNNNVGGLAGSNAGNISGSYVNNVIVIGNTDVGGLIGYNSSTISGSHVSGGSVTGSQYVGGLVGYNDGGSIDASDATASVTGDSYVGGLAGRMFSGVINFSHATGDVTGTGDYVGGLVGSAEWQFGIYDSYATGKVTSILGNDVGGLVGSANSASDTIARSYATGKVAGASYVGGLVGYNWDVNIDSSYATGNVTGTGDYVGGLVGYNGGSNYAGGSISNSYASGNVSGSHNVGGLVGYNDTAGVSVTGTGTTAIITPWGGRISNSYSSSGSVASTAVSGSANVGGLVGYNSGSISNSYASNGSVSSSGALNIGGLVGNNDFYGGSISNSFWNMQTTVLTNAVGFGSGAVTNATGLDTAGMMTMSNFTGWNITDAGGSTTAVWRIYEGNTTPLLASFLKPLTVTLGNDSKTYDGLAYVGGNGGVIYSDANAPLSSTLSGTLYGGPANGAVNAGGYIISASGLYSSQQGYDISYVDGSLVIGKANATVTANSDLSKTYNGLSQSVSGFSASGLVNSESASVLTGVIAGGSGTHAGTYASTASGTDGNYNLTFVNGSLVIGKASATVTANSDTTKIYNGLSQSVSGFTASGLVNSESASVLTGVIAGGSGTHAGTYASTASGTDGNYNLTFVNGSLVIGKASATVTANSDTTKIYNGLSQSVSGFSASGLVNGESASVLTGVIAGGSGTNAGSYLSTASGTDGNYNLTFVDGSLVIGKAALSLNAVTDSRIYNGTTTSAGVVTFTGLQTGDSIIATQSFDSRNAGTRNLSVTGYTVNDGNGGLNYFAPTLNTATGSITPASLTVTADYTSKILNSSDPLLTYMVSGLKLGDTVDTTLNTLNVNGGGALARLPGEAVGAYPINQGTLGLISTNYTMTYVGAAFTILPPISLPPIGINEIVNISLLLGTPDTGSAQSTSSEDEEHKPKPEDVVAADTNPADGTTAPPLLVCPM